MSERAAFIRQICENPADDVVRLVYADWLEDHGESERAAHIRWAVANPQNSAVCLCVCKGRLPNPCEICAMLGEEVANVPRQTNGETPYVANRGFVSEVRVPSYDFGRCAAFLFSVHPITSCRLTDLCPANLRRGSRGERCSAWWNGGVRSGGIPTILFKLLKPKWEGNCDVRRYKRPLDAWLDLSRACVAYGRDLAGLPPLPRPDVGVAAGSAGG